MSNFLYCSRERVEDMMEKIFLVLIIWRSIPAFIAFHSLQDKQAVNDDMRRWGEN